MTKLGTENTMPIVNVTRKFISFDLIIEICIAVQISGLHISEFSKYLYRYRDCQKELVNIDLCFACDTDDKLCP